MPNLVGIGNSQVPTNGMLGGLAYQDPAHAVLINTEPGDIAPIKRTINKTAAGNASQVAESIFIYETKDDSDGGSWRKKCAGKSWALETLGTATRGHRKEFPAVAVIVATTTEIIIYDGDDPNLSMWMIFEVGSGKWAKHNIGSVTEMCVHALNGVLCVGSDGGRFGIINFPGDRGTLTEDGYTYNHSRISERNDEDPGPNDGGSLSLRQNDISDISMAILERAPVDQDTGLPMPTIAVAVGTGMSLLQIPATSNWTSNTGNGESYGIEIFCTHSSHDTGMHVELMDGGRLAFVDGSDTGPGTNNCWIKIFNTIGISNNGITVNSHSGTTQNIDAVYSVQLTADNDLALLGSSGGYVRGYGSGSNRKINELVVTKDGFASGNWYGLTKIAEYPHPFERQGMVAYITNYYNTGWCFGNCQMATLSSVDDTDINGNNLSSLQNSGFGSATGWTVGSWNITGGQAVGGAGAGYLSQASLFTAGKVYAITVSVAAVSGTAYVYCGTGAPGSGNHYNAFATTGTHTFVLNAYGSSLGIYLASGVSCTLNEVWVHEAELNHHHGVSGANNTGDAPKSTRMGFRKMGTITKTKVAPGADLVGYSGWSDSNYLFQPYNGGMALTASYTIMFWAKDVSSSGWGYVCSRGTSDTNETFRICMDQDLGIYFDYGNGSQYCQSNRHLPTDWAHYVCTVSAGGNGRIYVNGKEQTYSANATAPSPLLNGNDWEMAIGRQVHATGSAFTGSLALFRISGLQPSDEQIMKIYQDEAPLFTPGAKCTLTGTQTWGASGAYENHVIRAIGYDKGTDILHVGTTGGRSDFDGLVRINSTSTPVTTAIAASNGLIVEQ